MFTTLQAGNGKPQKFVASPSIALLEASEEIP